MWSDYSSFYTKKIHPQDFPQQSLAKSLCTKKNEKTCLFFWSISTSFFLPSYTEENIFYLLSLKKNGFSKKFWNYRVNLQKSCSVPFFFPEILCFENHLYMFFLYALNTFLNVNDVSISIGLFLNNIQKFMRKCWSLCSFFSKIYFFPVFQFVKKQQLLQSTEFKFYYEKFFAKQSCLYDFFQKMCLKQYKIDVFKGKKQKIFFTQNYISYALFFMEVLFFSSGKFKNFSKLSLKPPYLELILNHAKQKKNFQSVPNFFSFIKKLPFFSKPSYTSEFIGFNFWCNRFSKFVFQIFFSSWKLFLKKPHKSINFIEKRNETHLFNQGFQISSPQIFGFLHRTHVLSSFFKLTKYFLKVFFESCFAACDLASPPKHYLFQHHVETFPFFLFQMKLKSPMIHSFDTAFLQWVSNNILNDSKNEDIEGFHIQYIQSHFFLKKEKTLLFQKIWKWESSSIYEHFKKFDVEKLFVHRFHMFGFFKHKKIFRKTSNCLKTDFFVLNESFQRHFLHPIYLFFFNYINNFIFVDSRLCIFVKNVLCRKFYTKIINDMRYLIEVVSNLSVLNLFLHIEKLSCMDISFVFFQKLFHQLTFSKYFQQKIFKFQNFFWSLSNQSDVFKTSLGPLSFFSIAPFFSIFLVSNEKSWIFSMHPSLSFLEKKFQILAHMDWEDFSMWILESYILDLKRTFFLQKKPTFSAVSCHLNECKKLILSSLGKNQFSFLKKLQKKIERWCFRYNSISDPDLFAICDSILFTFLWSWAQKTHPKKSKIWIRKKYFHFVSPKKCVFGYKIGNQLVCLPLHSQQIPSR